MPRKPRFFLPNVPVHMIIRGNSRRTIFAENDDYFAYRNWMKEGSESCDCKIHAYVLMTNLVHILLSAEEPSNLSKFSQAVGRKYVPFFNHKYNKSGTLWEGRFKASTIDSEHYLMACYRYIEMNPMRAGMVSECKDYPWSSYNANAYGERDALITPHFLYQRLGQTEEARQSCYRALFEEGLNSDLLAEIRQSTQTGTPLGGEKFRDEIEALLSLKVGYAVRGRPAKKGTDPL